MSTSEQVEKLKWWLTHTVASSTAVIKNGVLLAYKVIFVLMKGSLVGYLNEKKKKRHNPNYVMKYISIHICM